jgi:Xaa-Pro dipeptidase
MTAAKPLSDLYADHHARLLAHYQSLLETGGWRGVVISSGSPVGVFGDDQAHPFRVNPRFRQWIPEGEYSRSFLVIDAGDRPRFVCHQPEDYWHSAAPAPSGFWAEHFRLECVPGPEEADRLVPAETRDYAFLGDPEDCPAGISPGGVNPAQLVRALDYHRAYKHEYEVECIRRANRTAAAGHLAARAAFESGASELAIHLAYLQATGQLERQLPYFNIVALNGHGAVLHYDALEPRSPARVRSLLIDAGACHLGYAADITRTWTHAEDDFAALIERLDGAQRRLIAKIRPGMPFVELHREMHCLIGGVLADAGLVDMSSAAMVEEGVTAAFFPHGLGHHLGLQVHDVGGNLADELGTPLRQPEAYPFLRNLRTVEAGNVLTVEPGLYFIPQLLEALRARSCGRRVNWKAVDALRECGGVRIEDNVHVSGEGVENLTRAALAVAAKAGGSQSPGSG